MMGVDGRHESRPVCAWCGNEFEPHSDTQAFCDKGCYNRYYAAHLGDMSGIYPRRTFNCKNPKCRKLVVTEGPGDMRSKFCCDQCQRYYWRHCYNVSGKHRNVTQRYRNIGEAAKARAYQDHLFDEENAIEDEMLAALGFDMSEVKGHGD